MRYLSVCNKEELMEMLVKMDKEEEKIELKINYEKTKTMTNIEENSTFI